MKKSGIPEVCGQPMKTMHHTVFLLFGDNRNISNSELSGTYIQYVPVLTVNKEVNVVTQRVQLYLIHLFHV